MAWGFTNGGTQNIETRSADYYLNDVMSSTEGSFRGYGGNNPTDNLFQGLWRLGHDNLPEFEPFISGYAYVIWTHLPIFFDNNTAALFKRLTERDCRSFSGNNDINLEMEELTHGFNGNTIAYASNLKKDATSFTMRFYEKMGSPIRKLFEYWITGIRDPETGLATYHGAIRDGKLQYGAKNHVGELLYIVTDPSGGVGASLGKTYSGIEYAEYWTNVIPTKIPMTHLDMEKGSHTVADIDMEFRGNWHVGKAVNELAKKALQAYAIRRQYDSYGSYNTDNGEMTDDANSQVNSGYGEYQQGM